MILIGSFTILSFVLYFNYKDTVKIVAVTEYTKDQNLPLEVNKMRKQRVEGQELNEVYKELPLIDVHSHDIKLVDMNEKRIQDYGSYDNVWKTYGVDKTVLFGDISEPSAVHTDNW